MAQNEIEIKLTLVQEGQNLRLAEKQVKNLGKQTDNLDKKRKKLTKTTDKYNRREKGTAQMGMNSTKSFSKMQQGIDGGGGGTGGLVRAYALLAANVFALSAAFGILSRAAQVDTLVESMTRLEVVSGKSIKSVARDLQEAAGYGLDFAAAMRSTSLAMSAGFGGEEIAQLGEVARNAAVSLGRNLPDALDRIFRGVIKVEPELLDENGLFVRVNEASSKYAAKLGIAVGDITEFQKRQAFLNEAVEQGTNKFAAFAEVETDPFALLGTTFSDMTQGILTFINQGLGPIIRMLANSKMLFGTIFAALAITLIKLAVPAMGAFTNKIAQNAATASTAHEADMKAMQRRGQQRKTRHLEYIAQQKKELEISAKARMAETQAGPTRALSVGGKAKSKMVEKLLQKKLDLEKRSAVVNKRIQDIESARGKTARLKNAQTQKELVNLKAEREIHMQILGLLEQEAATKGMKGIADSSLVMQQNLALANAELRAHAMANIANEAQTQGFWAALRAVNSELLILIQEEVIATGTAGILQRAWFRLTGSAIALGVAVQSLWMKLMGPFSIFLMLLPVLQGVNKWLGVGSEHSKKLADANTAAAEALELLNPRLQEVAKVTAEAAFGTTKYNDAQAALSQTILTTLNSIDDQQKKLEAYMANASKWAKFWGEKFPAAFGGGTENAIARGKKAMIQGLKDAGDLSPKMKKLLAEYDAANIANEARGGTLEEAQEAKKAKDKAEANVLALAKTETDAMVNVKSAITGAADAARDFSNSMIVKTDVDKPLATFRQLDATMNNLALTDKKRASLLAEIVDDSAILTMVTKEEKDALQDTSKLWENRLHILTDIKDRYFEQQQTIIRSKAELKTIAVLNKNIGDLVKESTNAVKLKYQNELRSREINKEIMKHQVTNAVAASGVTKDKLKELSVEGALLTYMKTEEGKLMDISKIQAGINKLREEENELLEEKFELATAEARQKMDMARVELASIGRLKKINKESQRRLDVEQELATFSTGGPANWQKMELMIEKEKQNAQTRKDEALQNSILEKQKYEALAKKEEVLAEEFKDNAEKKQLYLDSAKALRDAGDAAGQAIIDAAKTASAEFVSSLLQMLPKGVEGGMGGPMDKFRSFGLAQQAIEGMDDGPEKVQAEAALMAAGFNMIEDSLLGVAETAKALFGDDGIMLAAMATSMAQFTNLAQHVTAAFGEDGYIANSTNKTAATVAVVAQAAADSIGMIMQLSAAKSQMAVKEIDHLIDAEKKRDGKSKESQQKIAALEKKKEMIKRKAFEDNKKMMLAQAIMSTAAAISSAIAGPPGLPWSAIFGVMAAVMGAAQISIIKGMTYKGGAGAAPSAPQEIQVGKRASRIDTSKMPTAGELSYLRGEKGIGRTPAQFTPTGGAAGMIRNYAAGGIVVGEQGPEVLRPTGGGYEVVPNEAISAGGITNANFVINAVDAAGVQDVLTNQRGNIISMIREAAHDHGEEFIEAVDTNAYGDASTSNAWTGKGGG